MADQEFLLDLHSHSRDGSDDAGATVEGYCKWIAARRDRGYRIDGFVLTEHRTWDNTRDYSDLAKKYDVVILRGCEVETDIGHVLVYGVNDAFLERIDIANVALPYQDVFKAADELGLIAIGAHAGRPGIGVVGHYEQRQVALEPIPALEILNGGSSPEENRRAKELAEAHNIRGIGGSDAHFVSAIGQCLTAFSHPIHTVEELVTALRSGEYRPVTANEVRDGSTTHGVSDSSGHMQASEGVTASAELEFDRESIGREVQGQTVTITKEMILAYCKAVNDTNPLYTDEAAAKAGPYGALIAPPTLLTTLVTGARTDPGVTFGNMQVLAGTRIDWVGPVRAGDTVSAVSSVAEVYQKTGRSGPMVFVVTRTRYVNQEGAEVGSMDTSIVRRQAQARAE